MASRADFVLRTSDGFAVRSSDAEKTDGNPVDLSTFAARHEKRGRDRRDGQTSALHRCALRAPIAGGGPACGKIAGRPRAITAAALKRFSLALVACLLGVAQGLSAPLGDFGRPRPSVIHDDVLPFFGKLGAKFRKEPVSDFRYTDYERELRDRSWALLMPQLERQYFQRWLAEMRRTRIISVEDTVPSRDNYVKKLLSRDYRSSGARFARLEMDIRNDRALYPNFVVVANTVAEYDGVRLRSLERTPDLTREETEDAYGRVEENRLLVWTVQKSMRERADIYRFALQRLVIETPDDAAIGAEQELTAFEIEIGVLPPPPPQFAVYGK